MLPLQRGCRLSPKKAEKCPAGGFVKMQTALIQGDDWECQICKTLLSKRGFKNEDLQKNIVEAIELGKTTVDQGHTAAAQEGQAAESPEVPEGQLVEECQVDEMDAFEYMKQFSPHIELLEAGTLGRKLPFKCHLCKTRGFPQGKIGDLCNINCMRSFIDRHVKSRKHQDALAAFNQEAAGPVMEPCEGVWLDDPGTSGHLYEIRREFDVWAKLANIKRFARHSYQHDANRDTWHLRAQKCQHECERLAEEGPVVCRECMNLGKCKSVSKTVMKFSYKFWPARWLSARLWHTQDAVRELETEIRESGSYKADPARFEQLMNLNLWQLQQVVRAGWESSPEDWATEASRDFLQICVRPCLLTNVQTVPKNLVDVAARFSAALASGRANDADAVNIRIAAACLDGRMDEHPFLQGVALQCLRMVEKNRRGIETMSGRRSLESAKEADLIRQAGLTMAINCGNKRLAQKLLV